MKEKRFWDVGRGHKHRRTLEKGEFRLWVWIRNLLKVRDTPEALARGLAVGFFFGVSFFWGLQILLAVLASYLVRGNKVVAATMTAVSNPLTTLPLYSFCYFVGHLILGGNDMHPNFTLVHSLEGFLALGPRFFITMLTGTTVVGLLGAVAVYFSSEWLLEALGRWHQRKVQDLPRARNDSTSIDGPS